MVSVTALHPPLLADVKINVTCLVVVSAELGTYVALSVVLFGVNVPLPDVLHVPEPVDEEPFNTWLGLLKQTLASAPAETFGAFVIVTNMVSVAALQFPFPLVVSIMLTLPAVVSTLLGIYVVFKLELLGENEPVPVLDQTPPVATVTEPVKATLALLPHTDWAAPALAVAPGVIVAVVVLVTAIQPPLLVVV